MAKNNQIEVNGIDWQVEHIDDKIKITTENDNVVMVDIDDYKKAVFEFVDKVEKFYKSCKKKILPDDEYDKNGYIAFWNEWERRRYKV